MTDPHFSHTKLVVEDLERSASFYGAALGLQEFGRADAEMNGRPGTEVMFAPTGDGGPMFVLVKFHDEARPSHSDVLLGFRTSDLEALCADIESAGGRITEPILLVAEHGVKVAFATDVEGNVLELLQLLEES